MTHITAMKLAEIMPLVDRYVFLQPEHCHGHCALSMERHGYVCEECDALENGNHSHRRKVPCYGIEEILIAMRDQRETVRACFVLNIRAAVNAPWLARGSLREFERLFAMLSTRMVAEAALKALGVIDVYGNVKESEVSHVEA